MGSASAMSDGVRDGTGTRCGVDCFRVLKGNEGVDGMASIERDGTGGADCTFSFPLNSRMNPLFFLTTVFGGALWGIAERSPGMSLCKSTADALAAFLPRAPDALAVRIRVRPPELCTVWI